MFMGSSPLAARRSPLAARAPAQPNAARPLATHSPSLSYKTGSCQQKSSFPPGLQRPNKKRTSSSGAHSEASGEEPGSGVHLCILFARAKSRHFRSYVGWRMWERYVRLLAPCPGVSVIVIALTFVSFAALGWTLREPIITMDQGFGKSFHAPSSSSSSSCSHPRSSATSTPLLTPPFGCQSRVVP